MNEISFTPTYEDLLAGQLLLNEKALKRLLPWSLLIGLLAISKTILDHGFTKPAAFIYDIVPYILMLMIVYAVIRKVNIPRIVRKTIRLQKSLSDPVHFRWTNDSLSISSKNGNSTVPLSDFACWLANEKVVLLFHSQSLFHFIPRRAFPDNAVWKSFLQTVAAAGVSNQWPPK